MDNLLLANLRKDYKAKSLDLADLQHNPLQQFDHWFQEALNSEIPEPNAMTLATATKDGKPSARIVLLKGFDEQGFVFYTNYEGRKGKEMDENPHVALVFCWLELERQIRIEGVIEKVTDFESEQYFHSRPRMSQIGSAASMQSTVIPDRKSLEDAFSTLAQTYEGKEIPRPLHWGGYRIKPDLIEFWQGRRSRLHDRMVYAKNVGGEWEIERLAP